MQLKCHRGKYQANQFMRLLSRCGLVAVLWTANCTAAQQTQQADLNVQHREPIRMERKPVQRPPVVIGNDGVLRLQATIRGDQQQPRILSIVPWDSPANRRTSRVALTGEISDTMLPLHRHTFLQRMTLHDQLKLAIPEAGSQ